MAWVRLVVPLEAFQTRLVTFPAPSKVSETVSLAALLVNQTLTLVVKKPLGWAAEAESWCAPGVNSRAARDWVLQEWSVVGRTSSGMGWPSSRAVMVAGPLQRP